MKIFESLWYYPVHEMTVSSPSNEMTISLLIYLDLVPSRLEVAELEEERPQDTSKDQWRGKREDSDELRYHPRRQRAQCDGCRRRRDHGRRVDSDSMIQLRSSDVPFAGHGRSVGDNRQETSELLT